MNGATWVKNSSIVQATPLLFGVASDSAEIRTNTELLKSRQECCWKPVLPNFEMSSFAIFAESLAHLRSKRVTAKIAQKMSKGRK